MRFDDRVAVVTGAAGDIGRELACRLAGEGALVACVDIDEAGTAATASRVREDGGIAEPIPCDLTQWPQVERATASIVDVFGRVDVVFANAGGSRGETIPFLELSPARWADVVDRNLTSAFHTGLAFARVMGRGGVLVFTTSELAEVLMPGFSAYSAAKAGVRQLVRAMAVDLAPLGIRVNAVAPGPTLTDGTRTQFSRPEVAAELARRIPLGRVARPDEIVGAALLLASGESSFTTGATIAVDGGLTAV